MNERTTSITQGIQLSPSDSKKMEIRKRRHIAAKSLLRFLARVLLVIVICTGIFFSIAPQGRAALRTTLLLPALLSASDTPLLNLSAEPVMHTSRTLSSNAETTYLDIYQPTSPAPLLGSERGSILVLAGVGDNRQVPQLVNLLHTFAQTGMVVMNVTAPSLMNYSLATSDTEAVVQAFLAFEHFPGMANRHIGILSFSGGAPIACFVAADARIRDRVAFVSLFGGYFRTVDVLHAFGQRAITLDGHARSWQPDAVPIQTLTNVITQHLTYTEQTSIQDAVVNGKGGAAYPI